MEKKFRKLFLPLGIILALLLAFLWPTPGVALRSWHCNNFFIVLIFIICGWQTELKDLHFDRRFCLLLVGGAVIALVVAPGLGRLTAQILQLDAAGTIGLVVISAVPPTLSSGVVLTETANGNQIFSLTITIFYNLLGVIVMPLMLAWTLSGIGEISTNPAKMFGDLALLVVLPFFGGLLIRKWSKIRPGSWGSYTSSSCVIILLLTFFSSSSELLKNCPLSLLAAMGLGGIVIHLVLMALMWYPPLLVKAAIPDRKALLFSGGSKTITIALATLTIIGAAHGPAVIPGLVYYFCQMLIDSVLAGRMGLKSERPTSVVN